MEEIKSKKEGKEFEGGTNIYIKAIKEMGIKLNLPITTILCSIDYFTQFKRSSLHHFSIKVLSIPYFFTLSYFYFI
jgi:hypothetical protein